MLYQNQPGSRITERTKRKRKGVPIQSDYGTGRAKMHNKINALQCRMHSLDKGAHAPEIAIHLLQPCIAASFLHHGERFSAFSSHIRGQSLQLLSLPVCYDASSTLSLRSALVISSQALQVLQLDWTGMGVLSAVLHCIFNPLKQEGPRLANWG